MTVPEPAITPDPEQPVGLDKAATREPIHTRDQVPDFVLRAQAWLYSWFSTESRLVLGLVIVVLAIVALFVLSSTRFLSVLIDGLDVVAFLGLFLVNWLGNGGALVPIPGARFVGMLMVFQQAVLMPSWEVWLVGGAGMSLGLLSYYLAGVRTAASYAEGDTEGAEKLATQTGMLDEDATEFSPGAGLDASAVSALAGVKPEPAESSAEGAADARGQGRLRQRFTTSLKKTQARAEPIIKQRGAYGMFLLCFAPTPMGTAAAYLGGLLRFGFSRYLLASFTAKLLLAGIIVLLALVFSDAAHAVQIPEIELPVIDVTLFDDGQPASPAPGASATPASD